MSNEIRLILVVVAAISLPVIAADQPAMQPETLSQFIQQSWKVPSFQLGRDSVMSTVPLRISTYSSPPFIHRGQLENLSGQSKDLGGLCERQSGQWRYVGPPVVDKPTSGQPLPPNAATADAVNHAPVSEAGIQEIVKTGEQGVASDVWKMMVRDMLKQPDPLVADALEYAVRQKWLGRFECLGAVSSWSASISYAKWANRTDRGNAYKDVTLKVVLTDGK
jgi:hypothetical protein